MKINTLGQFLQFYRKKYCFKQSDICVGICSNATLSRVENGSKIVDSLVAESLLGRIGKEVVQFEIMLNDRDYYLWTTRQEIQKKINEETYDKAKELLVAYYEKMPKDESVHEQIGMYYKAQIKLRENAPTNEICELLYSALKMTKPNIEEGIEENIPYNPIEIEMIVLLMHYNYSLWEGKDKERMLLLLFHFVDKIYSGRQKERQGTKILMELIEQAKKLGENLRVINYADKAIEFISRGRGIDYIAELHFIKAKMLEQIFCDNINWKEHERECKEEALMAYYVFDVLNKQKEKEEVKQFCEGRLRWQIIE